MLRQLSDEAVQENEIMNVDHIIVSAGCNLFLQCPTYCIRFIFVKNENSGDELVIVSLSEHDGDVSEMNFSHPFLVRPYQE